MASPAREAKRDAMRASVLRSMLLASATTLLLASNAFAARPERSFIPVPSDVVLPADSGYCSFDVLLQWPIAREYTTTWTYPDGSVRIEITGYVEQRTTNLATGKSLFWNASGPGQLAFDADGNFTTFVAQGHLFAYGPLFGLQAGGIYDYQGRVDILAGTQRGHRIDVCAALS
jgi:hypothetical protein